MYERVFNRVEEKYLLTKQQYQQLFKMIRNEIVKDQYYETTICNIYFDTKEKDLIIQSLEKPPFKQKVRLRSYGIPTLESPVFLEIKEKYKKNVGKRRIQLSLQEFYDYYQHKTKKKQHQIMDELDYLFDFYQLEPSYFIAYERKSYVGLSNQDLRITIDQNLRSRTHHLKLEDGDEGETYFPKNQYIMEIKCLEAMPLWLVKSLSLLKIYPISFSKYGNIYSKKKEKEVC